MYFAILQLNKHLFKIIIIFVFSLENTHVKQNWNFGTKKGLFILRTLASVWRYFLRSSTQKFRSCPWSTLPWQRLQKNIIKNLQIRDEDAIPWHYTFLANKEQVCIILFSKTYSTWRYVVYKVRQKISWWWQKYALFT